MLGSRPPSCNYCQRRRPIGLEWSHPELKQLDPGDTTQRSPTMTSPPRHVLHPDILCWATTWPESGVGIMLCLRAPGPATVGLTGGRKEEPAPKDQQGVPLAEKNTAGGYAAPNPKSRKGPQQTAGEVRERYPRRHQNQDGTNKAWDVPETEEPGLAGVDATALGTAANEGAGDRP